MKKIINISDYVNDRKTIIDNNNVIDSKVINLSVYRSYTAEHCTYLSKMSMMFNNTKTEYI